MKRLAPALLVAALFAAPAAQARQEPPPPVELMRSHANPGNVIAAEVALSQLARKEGQWAAFRETSAPEAEMFTPQRTNAEAWLDDRPNPPQPLNWEPQEVWSSCDGSYAVTRGAWQQSSEKFGYFSTLWQRQPKKGDYKWLLKQRHEIAAPVAAPEMITGLVADCRARTPGPVGEAAAQSRSKRKRKSSDIPPSPATNPRIPDIQPIAIALEGDRKDGRSRDGTLDWSSVVAPDGERVFVVRMWKDGEMREVLRAVAHTGLEVSQP